MVAPIMVPVDLAHAKELEKSVKLAVEIANLQNASLTLVSVTEAGPSEVAKSEGGYAKALEDFGAELSDTHRLKVDTITVHSVDTTAELGDRLIATADDMGAEVIVMASHVPGVLEHFFASNAGYVASHAKCSVFVVR
ncbi:MAG: universal stress protein [Paracoccaceae bacterium]